MEIADSLIPYTKESVEEEMHLKLRLGRLILFIVLFLSSWHQLTHHLFHQKTSEDEKGAAKVKAPLEQWIDLIENLHRLQGSTDLPRKRRGRKAHNEVPKDHVPLLGKVRYIFIHSNNTSVQVISITVSLIKSIMKNP